MQFDHSIVYVHARIVNQPKVVPLRLEAVPKLKINLLAYLELFGVVPRRPF
jgi:hypothetical protein